MTQACAETLLSSWVSRFGVPDDITMERGPVFLSEIWLALANLMGTTLHSTMAYNPAANGMVERTHRTLKASLMASCTNADWKSLLPWDTTPRADGEPSPAEKVYREALTDRTKHFKPRNLDNCGYVFVRVDAHRQPLTRPYRGPYRVISKTTNAFLLDVHGQEDWVSIDRMKPAFFEGSDTASAGPGRSRVPPQNKAPNEKKSNKRQREVAIHTPTAEGALRRPKRYED
ncbi:uncharacterized protein [Palaemon carinicauda]|uniref:uncharacterized protein n=1 Tax=Palaemon carinicauda TaxID=392227 RepID=UPI0035B5AC26